MKLSLSILLAIIVMAFISWGITETIDKDKDLYGIKLNSKVSLEDGSYRFNYSEVGNYLGLATGTIVVRESKIVSITGSSELSPVWNEGLPQCLYNLKEFFNKYNGKITNKTESSMDGYVGYTLNPKKHYLSGNCSVSDGSVLMSVSLAAEKEKYTNFKETKLSDEAYKQISGIVDWIPSKFDFSPYVSDSLAIEKYHFLTIDLNSKFDDFERSEELNFKGKKFYKVNTFGYENNYTLKSDLEDIEINNMIGQMGSFGNLGNIRDKDLNEKIADKNFYLRIEPVKTYVELDEKDNIKNIYSLTYSQGVNHCVKQMSKYILDLLTRHKLDYTFDYYQNGKKLDKAVFMANDKVNNVSIELTCYNKVSSYMSIKFMKNDFKGR